MKTNQLAADTAIATPPAATANTPALLRAIADLLAGQASAALPGFGVGTGKGGSVLFFCHYAAYTGEACYYDLALHHLEQALAGLSPRTYQAHLGCNYYQELAEIGRLLCYLSAQGHLDWDNTPLLNQIDDLLEARLQHFLERGNLEIIDGALHIGTYFLRRAPQSARARQQLDGLLDAIHRLRQGTDETGYCWPCNIIAETRVYTGISHGSAMVMSFLAAVHEAGIRPAECEVLLFYATRFLLGTQQDPDQLISTFPLWLGRGEPVPNLCLLYGDLGPAYAIARAANVLDHAGYRAEAVRIGRRTTQRVALPETFLHDASVWYGAAGTHLLYDALHRQTGEADFATAAAYWLAHLPRRADPAAPHLGFRPHFFADQPAAPLCFNFGLVGIGLTLLQALSGGQHRLDEFIWLA